MRPIDSYSFFHRHPHQSVFHRHFDTIIFGAGLSGFAAALTARQAGLSVLLVDDRGDLVWEAGRNFAPDPGDCDREAWQNWKSTLEEAGALSRGTLTPGATEIVSTRLLLEQEIQTLYYATPVAVQCEANRLRTVTMATPSGLRQLEADQWIDATESGLIAQLLDPSIQVRKPAGYQLTLGLQSQNWQQINLADLPSAAQSHGLQSLAIQAGATGWERLLVARAEGDPADLALWMLQALEALAATASETAMAGIHLSHSSTTPLPLYRGGLDTPIGQATTNLTFASPALSTKPMHTMADRFQLGLESTKERSDHMRANRDEPLPPLDPSQLRTVSETETDLVVAGLGTGGAVAAIAARRTADVGVIGIEPLWLPGGIGTVGGIHKYHRGIMGGLQKEVDDGVLSLMNRWPKLFQTGAFSPWAKQIVLTGMLKEAGAERRHDRRVIAADTESSSGRLISILVSGPAGVEKLTANAWVDGTADAVLTSQAGGRTWFGRAGDRQTQCYSQSAAVLAGTESTGPRTTTTNIDSGWCDSSDAEDLTRARMIGIDQYYPELQAGKGRWIYVSPALGLRQGPMIECDYTVTLDEAVYPKFFDDAISYYCCQQDTHNPDVYFEDDDTFYWCWVIGQRGAQIAGTLPYRSLLPKGLANVWIGSRALGVSQAVQYAARQQRDIQRIGEVAGIAAALAVRGKNPLGSREIDFSELQKRLKASGALEAINFSELRRFGNLPETELLTSPPVRPSEEAALADLDAGEQSRKLWVLKTPTPALRQALRERLQSSNQPWPAKWATAKIAGFWGLPEAEAVMLEVIGSPAEHCDNFPKALALLRTCGTPAALGALENLASTPARLTLDVRVLLLMALEAITLRESLSSGQTAAIRKMAEHLSERPVPGARHANKYNLFENAHAFLTDTNASFSTKQKDISRAIPSAVDDHTWRLDLWVARVLQAAGSEALDIRQPYQDDPRPIVRRAFEPVQT